MNRLEKQGLNSMLEYHRKLLLHFIRVSSPISRADLTRITKLSPTTVGRIIGSLLEEGLVHEEGLSDASLGRKARLLFINASSCYAAGIDVDMRKIRGGIVDLGGNVVFETFRASDEILSVDTAVQLITEVFEELQAQLDAQNPKKFLGVGITVTGNIQPASGVVKFSPQLKWSDVPLRDLLIKKLNTDKIFIDNDVKGDAMAEILFGCGRKNPDFIVLYAGTGVGTAVVKNDKVIRSANGLYGEIGHMTLHPFGRLCDCGRLGCVQTEICIPALEKEAGIPFSDILTRAGNGDLLCRALLNRAEQSFAVLVSNVVNMYDPPLILLKGELFDLIEGFRDRVIEQAKYLMYHGFMCSPTIASCSFTRKEDIVISGASIVFHNEFAF